MRLNLRIASLLLVTVNLLACALNQAKPAQTVVEAEKLAPVEVRVVQAFRDEKDNLNLKVHVQAKTLVRTDNVSVTFLGLKDGEVVEEETKKLRDIFPQEMMKREQLASLAFVVPAKGINEYQVQCNWDLDENLPSAKIAENVKIARAKGEKIGADAASVEKVTRGVETGKAEHASEVKKAVALGVSLTKVERRAEACEAEVCQERLFAILELSNDGDSALKGPELGVSLTFVPLGGQLPEIRKHGKVANGEDIVSLSSVSIAPGKARTVRVAIEQSVPMLPGGRFEPQIRVLP